MSLEPSPTTPMESGDPSSAKKARVGSSPNNPVKQEAAGDDEAGSGSGGRALSVLGGDTTAVAAAAMAEEVGVKILRNMLHCPVCKLPLKPPVFQCGFGHTACGSCHGDLLINQCHSCAGACAYTPCPAMDALISKVLVPCPHESYGCRDSVAYYLAGDHGSACAYAPCACREWGCAFLGTPAMVLSHLAAAPHCWPVDKVKYGEVLRVRVPDTEPRRLLVAEEEDGGVVGGARVFVLAVGDRAARTVPVTVACLRAPGAAAAGPQFACKMWATGCKAPALGKMESVLVEMEVPSVSAAGEVAPDKVDTFLPVLRKMLRGASSQMHLSVRIDKV